MSPKDVLNELIKLNGVVSSLIVDSEGNILHSIEESFPFEDLKKIAMIASRGLKSAENIGQALSKGICTYSVIEYVDNIIIMDTIPGSRILVIIANKGAILGRIKIEMQKRKKDLTE